MRLFFPGLLVLMAGSPMVAQDFLHDPSENLSFTVGVIPEDTTLGDFDDDGDLDVAVANTYFGLDPQTGTVSVLFNNGDGTFEQMLPVETVVGLRSEGVTSADFDEDGFDDIAVTSFESGNVSILLSNGAARSFGAPTDLTPNHPGRHVRTALIDNDSHYDLMTANYDDDTLSIFLGNGDGTFDLPDVITLVDNGPETIVYANVNGDANLDVIVPNALSNNVSVLHGQGDGTFLSGALVPTLDRQPRFAVAYDFDGDARDDFVTSHFRDALTVKVFGNDGDGTSFTNVFTDDSHPYDKPIAHALGDLNNDGLMDFTTSFLGRGDNVIGFYPGDGNLGFGPRQDIPVGEGPYGMLIHDFNNDNVNDLMAVEIRVDTVTFLFGQLPEDAEPVAVIDSISPNPALVGQAVSFVGRGLPVGTITSVQWTSDLVVPVLSTQESFSTGSLPAGNHTISFRVENAEGDFDVASMPLTISTPPDPPTAIIDGIAPNPATSGQSVTFSGRGTPAGTITSYLWTSSLDGTLSSQEDFSSASLSEGTHQITLRVENLSGADEETVSLTINPAPPNPPTAIIDSISPNPATEGDTIAFAGRGTPAASITAHLWTSSLNGTLSTSASFSRTLSEGTHLITYRVTNPSGFDEATATLVVDPLPDPTPTAFIDGVAPNPSLPGQNVTFQGRGEPLASITSYEWRTDQLAEPLSSQRNFATALLAPGTHLITLRVENGAGFDEAQTTLVVGAEAEAIIESITPSPATDSELVMFVGRGEPAGDIASFVWTSDLVAGNLSEQSSFSAMLPSGMHTITLQVESSTGLVDTETTSLQVDVAGPRATISSIGPDPVTEGETVEFTGSATPENEIIAYLWRSNLVGDDLSTQASFATDALPPGQHTITFQALDQNQIWSPEAESTLSVQERPVATISSITPSPAVVGTPVSFTGTATPPGDVEAYRWRTAAGDELSDQAAFSSDALPAGSFTILFSARNDLGVWSDEDSRTLEIEPIRGEDIFVDDGDLETQAIGLWNVSIGPNPFGSKSLFSSQAGASYSFNPTVPETGEYEIALRWTTTENRRTNVPVVVEHDGGTADFLVNQQQNAGEWFLLGSFTFTDEALVTVRSLGRGTTTCVDGLRLTPVVGQ